jgi:hypothetical protein
MRVGQVYRQSLQMAHFIANRCHIPNPSVKRRPAPETSSSKSIGCRPPRHIHNPLELMLFARWHGQRIDTVFIFYRKVRPCSEQHRPDTEASQIAEVHLSDRIFQNEGRVRDGEHIVGADSTLHYPVFLPPGRIFSESIQDTSGRPYTNRVAHPESLQSQVVVYRDFYILPPSRDSVRLPGSKSGRAGIDLLQIPAVLPAQLGAGTAEIMGAEMLDPDLLR